MKTFLAIQIRFGLAALVFGAVLSALSATSQAAIVIIGGTVTETFATQPPASSWSTTAGGFGTGSGNITGDGTADAIVGTPGAPTGSVTAALVSAQLPAAATSGTVALQAESRYHDVGFISTAPTGVDGSLTMVTLTNGTGINLSTLSIRYDLGIQNGNVLTPEDEFAGHRVYWSLTGNVNSWNPIGNFGFRGAVGNAATQTQTQSFDVPFSTWAPGTDAFVLWLDDNALNNPDGLYFMDNIAFTAVPEPSAGLLVMGAFGVYGFIRHRMT